MYYDGKCLFDTVIWVYECFALASNAKLISTNSPSHPKVAPGDKKQADPKTDATGYICWPNEHPASKIKSWRTELKKRSRALRKCTCAGKTNAGVGT